MIEFGLYTPRQGADAGKITTAGNAEFSSFDKATTTYPHELDIALQAWQEVSATAIEFNNHNNPHGTLNYKSQGANTHEP